jgi:hypothetical protein
MLVLVQPSLVDEDPSLQAQAWLLGSPSRAPGSDISARLFAVRRSRHP